MPEGLPIPDIKELVDHALKNLYDVMDYNHHQVTKAIYDLERIQEKLR